MGELGRAAPRGLNADEAARALGVPPEVVRALAVAGYLPTMRGDDGSAVYALGDVKAFQARNASDASADVFDEAESVDVSVLIDALDGRSDEMAQRVFEVFSSVYSGVHDWPPAQRERFVEQARLRFEAILAVTKAGQAGDAALLEELVDVGAVAAWSGSPLAEVLLILRISRDLVVQTAVELAEEQGRHWGLALSLVLTRVLPALDRLIDAVAQGYWSAVVGREEEDRARYENVVEHTSDGIYEVDVTGEIRYANPSLAMLLGVRHADIVGARLVDVLRTVDTRHDVDALVAPDAPDRVELRVRRDDGVERVLDVRPLVRREKGVVVGYEAVVRDVTGARELEVHKNEFLALITHELRQPLTTILGLGDTLETHGGDLAPERVGRMGASIRAQADRMTRMADDLYAISRLEANNLLLSPRRVDLAAVVDGALGAVSSRTGVEVRVQPGLAVYADARRLEQVVANLVENGLAYGAAPVVVTAGRDDEHVELAVRDHGDGVPEALRDDLFARFHPSRASRMKGTGLGLALVRGLVEAMAGRVWYEDADPGARFCLTLPAG